MNKHNLLILLWEKLLKKKKTIEYQGEKQIDALENLKDQENKLVNDNDDNEDKLSHSKEREIFEDIYKKRLDRKEELTNEIDDNNLISTTLGTGETMDFTGKSDTLTLL